MHALVLRCINQYTHYTKFKVPRFTNYKDMIGVKFKKMGQVTLNTSVLGVVCNVG